METIQKYFNVIITFLAITDHTKLNCLCKRDRGRHGYFIKASTELVEVASLTGQMKE